jgi:TonB-dependent receptor
VAVPHGSIDGLCAANPGYCNASNFGKGSMTGSFPTSAAGKPGDVLGIDPGDTYLIHETKISAYAMATYDGEIGGLGIAGNAGVRGVHIHERADGFQGTVFRLGTEHTPDPTMPDQTNLVRDTNSYWKVLPTANITIKPTHNINLRFAAAKTISLPDLSSLSPTGTATVILPDASGGAQPSFFSGGNTQLRPTQAWNFDFTAEYYLRNGGALIGSLFYKDVKNLVQGVTTLGTVPGQGDRIFNISTTGNAQSGRAYGAEFGVNEPLSFLPGALGGLGIQANYTYINSKARFAGIGEVPFGGTSTHNANASVYYQHGGWDGRLSYTYRSKQLVSSFSPVDRDYLKPQYSLDFNINRKISDHLEARINLVNLTGRDVYQYASSSGRLEDYYQRARTFLVGFRASF